jgi:hypothetical protein
MDPCPPRNPRMAFHLVDPCPRSSPWGPAFCKATRARTLWTYKVGLLVFFFRGRDYWRCWTSGHRRYFNYYKKRCGDEELVSLQCRYPHQLNGSLKACVLDSMCEHCYQLETIDEPVLLFCNASMLQTVYVPCASIATNWRLLMNLCFFSAMRVCYRQSMSVSVSVAHTTTSIPKLN